MPSKLCVISWEEDDTEAPPPEVWPRPPEPGQPAPPAVAVPPIYLPDYPTHPIARPPRPGRPSLPPGIWPRPPAGGGEEPPPPLVPSHPIEVPEPQPPAAGTLPVLPGKPAVPIHPIYPPEGYFIFWVPGYGFAVAKIGDGAGPHPEPQGRAGRRG